MEIVAVISVVVEMALGRRLEYHWMIHMVFMIAV